MKFGFVTCVQLGLTCMESIYEAGGKLDLVISLKDDMAERKSGRIYVDDFCKRRSIPVLKTRNINDEEAVEAIRKHQLDWLFVIGWSQIAREAVLQAPRLGVVGIHPTLLPQGRGRAAIPWAILKGLRETGVTMFKLDEGMDTGPIIAQEKIILAPDETASVLYEKVSLAHASIIKGIWADFAENNIRLVPQEEAFASEWPGRRPEDGQIGTDMTVEEVDRLVRAVTRPYPGAFYVEGRKTYRIWQGRPLGLSGRDPQPGFSIHLKDGVYLATEFQVEAES